MAALGWWQVSTDALARSRFVVSPLAECVAALMTLERGTAAHPGERGWLHAHLPLYRRRLADDPVTALIVRSALGARWTADFLTPAPAGEGPRTFAEEVARVRETPPAVARADLAVSLAGGPLPARLRRADVPGRTADLLDWVWTRTVLPTWPRRRRVIEADVVARTGQLTGGGWASALDDLRPGMRWLGEGRLQINTYDNPPRDLSGAPVLFVPVTPRVGWSCWDAAGPPGPRYALVYPCSGPLAAAAADLAPVPAALGALLGPARAAVLMLLDAPKSTTQLVALTGQGLGSVGRHLKILLDARLVRRRRAGRSVLYFRTDAGDALLAAVTGKAPAPGSPR